MDIKLLATMGLPRSGKSTICKEVYIPLGYTVVSPDDFRLTMFGQRYYAPGEPLLWATIYNVVDTLLLTGNKVILDATNLLEIRRTEWIRRGAQFVFVDTPMKECLRRAALTDDDYIVPVIERMNTTREPISKYEKATIAATHKWSAK